MGCRIRARALACGLLIAVLVGCGGDDSAPPGGDIDTGDVDGGTGMRRCDDEDGDGFQTGCSTSRRDCDDSDPMITDECRRCVTPNEGCPCEPGTESMRCDPEDVRMTREGVTGVVICDEGSRWCRDGAWSDCEILWQYATFVPDT